MKKLMSFVSALVFVFCFSVLNSMERPPRAGRSRRSLADADKSQPGGKKAKPDKALVMPEFDFSTPGEVRRLIEAAARGDLEYVRKNLPEDYFDESYLGQSAFIGSFACQDNKGRCMLSFAALNRHVKLFDFLLQSEDNFPYYLDFPYIRKQLVDALKTSDERIVTSFINRVIPDTYEHYKKLFVALLLDSEEGINEELRSASLQFACGDENGKFRPLHAAVVLRSSVGIRLLHVRGCPIDIVNGDEHTALDEAISCRYADIVEELLKAGAETTFLNSWACSKVLADSQEGILELLLNHRPRANTLCDGLVLSVASGHADLKSVQLLLDHGAAANVCDENGKTPLHYAISYPYCSPRTLDVLAIVRLLLQNGADVNARIVSRAEAGKTVLRDALMILDHKAIHFVDASAKIDHIKIVHELLSYGARAQDQETIELVRRVFKDKPLIVAVICGDSIDAAACSADRHVLNEALRFALAQRSNNIASLIEYGAEIHSGVEFLDEILRRPHLTVQAREQYKAIRDNLTGESSTLENLIIRRNGIHDALIRNPQFSHIPNDLKERMLPAILLSGVRAYNRDRVCRALCAGADPTPFLALIPRLRRNPEIADLLVLAAQARNPSLPVPDWLVSLRPQKLVEALSTGDSSYVRLMIRSKSFSFDDDFYIKFLQNCASAVDPASGFKLMKTLLDAHDIFPKIVLDMIHIAAKRPAIVSLIIQHARAAGLYHALRSLLGSPYSREAQNWAGMMEYKKFNGLP